ncbi:hypothetical protein K5I29_10410 [Flavobacterium agricola]|uniref:Class I SAM-dependent methyltransferase n=1 Tax=Flavobacterium agricola TaxID=2870839 RepID=A0ABY6LZR7_9FLAO|nr:hypothetical protein [Flavobacterium agricola]UYW00909.1 hypothetical protein K5I29_10410 [Flavobacterium agricola]
MNHKSKTRIFKALNILPSFLGYTLYHYLQNIKSSKNFNSKLKSNIKTYNKLEEVLTHLNLNLNQKKIIEIGSGWIPAMPYEFLFKGNASLVYTYDLNHHYQKSKILNFNIQYFTSESYKDFSRTKYGIDDRIIYMPKKKCNS